MIRTVICDDEKAALHIIQYFIEKRYEHFKINSLGKEKPTTTLFQQVP